ncbi:hypothetical protein EBB05_16350 [Methylobacterium brachiatum]|nr:hypothetical protein EBB05_16350 [Methylobacterium brachiatum]
MLPAAQIEAGQDHDSSHNVDARITRLLTARSSAPLPAPGSEEAKAAFKAACHEHTIRTQFANEYLGLKRSPLEWWTADSLGKALETGELTPEECARLYPSATERELRMAQIEHELNLGALHALAFAESYPVAVDEMTPDPAEEERGVDAEPTAASVAEPSSVFVAIADGARSAANDALSDARVSPELRIAVEAHRDATLAMLLEPDESNEASNARCGVVEQTGAALRAVPARSLADVRCKLALLLPEILPDVNGSDSTAFLENIREDVDRLARQPVPAPISASLVGQIDFASGSIEDLRALRDSANSVGDAAYAMAWTGRCHTGPAGKQHNAAGKLMQWLGDALADVADEARKEAQRRRPKTPNERETRLTILAGPTIDNGDPDEIAALAGEMLAHAAAEARGA